MLNKKLNDIKATLEDKQKITSKKENSESNSLPRTFKEIVKGVKPLPPSNRVNLSAQKQKRQAFDSRKLNKQQKQEEENQNIEYLSDGWQEKLVDFEETLKFCHSSISSRYFKDLRMGYIPIEDHLDLHGLTVEQARNEIGQFLHFSTHHHIRCVRIIHGKGYRKDQEHPILKNKVNTWLKQHPDVLAFHSALAKDGGTGAVYVLLKQHAFSN